jgi:hypothetical protein
MEYVRTVLIVGNKANYMDFIRVRFRERLARMRIPSCARMVIVDEVRYVHVCTSGEARGYLSDETTYKYVGPYWPQVENVLLECQQYTPEVSL